MQSICIYCEEPIPVLADHPLCRACCETWFGHEFDQDGICLNCQTPESETTNQ